MDHTPSAEQATARCRATDKTLHQRPVPRTRARGVGRAGSEAEAGGEATAGTFPKTQRAHAGQDRLARLHSRRTAHANPTCTIATTTPLLQQLRLQISIPGRSTTGWEQRDAKLISHSQRRFFLRTFFRLPRVPELRTLGLQTASFTTVTAECYDG